MLEDTVMPDERRSTREDAKPRSNDNLIQFRATGALLAYLRQSAGLEANAWALSEAARAKLGRWMAFRRHELGALELTADEARVIVLALGGREPDPADLLWARVERAAEALGTDQSALVARLKTLSYGQALALQDACECWWANISVWASDEDGLRIVGLIE